MKKITLLVCAIFSMTIGLRASEYEYKSEPSGVVVEGEAMGIEQVTDIRYDAAKNIFVLNGGAAAYRNPISKDEFKELLAALAQHNHIGVSIRSDRTFFTYGRVTVNGRIGKELAAADKILGGVVFGIREYIANQRLPGGYKPQSVNESQRRVLSVATFHFREFNFAKGPDGVYARQGYNFTISMMPVHKDRRAADGGYVKDEAARQRGDIEPADQSNLTHVLQYQGQYLAVPSVEKVAKIGEAAAFIRWVRGGSVAKGGAFTGGRSDLLQKLAGEMR